MFDTNYHQQGYDKGYEDGLVGNSRIDTWIIDMVIPTSEAEDEWKEGYAEGYDQGEEERRASQE